MDYKFADLVDIHELQELMDSFYEVSQLSFLIADEDDNILVASGLNDICSKFHLTNPITAKRCIEGKRILRSCKGMKQEYYGYKCKNGLVNIAIPVIVEGNNLATVFFCQFLSEKPERDLFLQQAEDAGFNADLYLMSLDTVPVFNKEEICKIVSYYSNFANLLSDMILQNLKQKKYEAKIKVYSEELALNEEKLKSLDNMKNELISTFSHELKTPLSIIKGYSELLHDACLGPLEQCQKSTLDTVLLNIRKLESLVDSLLYLGMEHSNDHFYEYLPLNISDIIEAAVIDATRDLKLKNMSLQTNIPKTVPIIHGDGKKLFQALCHLLDNAIKFSPSGSIINISVTEADGRLYLSIKDNGIGIVEEQLSRIFEVFYQGDSSLTRKYAGVGLGLDVCQRIIKRHEGNIRVESKINEGSTFRIDLPVRDDLTNSMSFSN